MPSEAARKGITVTVRTGALSSITVEVPVPHDLPGFGLETSIQAGLIEAGKHYGLSLKPE